MVIVINWDISIKLATHGNVMTCQRLPAVLDLVWRSYKSCFAQLFAHLFVNLAIPVLSTVYKCHNVHISDARMAVITTGSAVDPRIG